MKRKLLLSVMLCVFAGLTLLNLGLARSQDNTDTTLDLISVMAKAYDEGEIPEVIIICSLSGVGPSGGRCYDPTNCRMEWTPFGPRQVQDCTEFTGYTKDQCLDGWPCLADPV